jgi:hypothetical protein
MSSIEKKSGANLAGAATDAADGAWSNVALTNMLQNPAAVEKTISDGMWKRINQLDESKRAELFQASQDNTIHQHPIFIQIKKQILQELHLIQPNPTHPPITPSSNK